MAVVSPNETPASHMTENENGTLSATVSKLSN
jgi:hypothetical protein